MKNLATLLLWAPDEPRLLSPYSDEKIRSFKQPSHLHTGYPYSASAWRGFLNFPREPSSPSALGSGMDEACKILRRCRSANTRFPTLHEPEVSLPRKRK